MVPERSTFRASPGAAGGVGVPPVMVTAVTAPGTTLNTSSDGPPVTSRLGVPEKVTAEPTAPSRTICAGA